MQIPKELLEKIINLRDLRQAIGAVKTQNLKKDEQAAPKPASVVPYEEYKKRYLSGELPDSHIPEDFLHRLRQEGHARPDHKPDDTEVIPKPQNHSDLKYINQNSKADPYKSSRYHAGFRHVWNIPGTSNYYELDANRHGNRPQYSVQLIHYDKGQRQEISRSPSVFYNLKDAAADLSHHHSKKKWSHG